MGGGIIVVGTIGAGGGFDCTKGGGGFLVLHWVQEVVFVVANGRLARCLVGRQKWRRAEGDTGGGVGIGAGEYMKDSPIIYKMLR